MEIKVRIENKEIIVEIRNLNIVAKFDEMDEATQFIQSMITNVQSF